MLPALLSHQLAGSGGGLPAVLDDGVEIVLQGLGPVVHEVLVDGVGVDEGRAFELFKQGLGEFVDERLGLGVAIQAHEDGPVRIAPGVEAFEDALAEGGEFGVFEDGGLDALRGNPGWL